jgi:DNA-binding response OmpR family regulator
VSDVLVASDSPSVVDEVSSCLGKETTLRKVPTGRQIRAAVAELRPDLVVLDLQTGSMGGMAACLDLRLEEGAGRLPRVPVLMLLDRRPDVFLARRSSADGWVLKPLDPVRLRKAITQLMSGGTYEDPSRVPPTVAVPAEPVVPAN